MDPIPLLQTRPDGFNYGMLAFLAAILIGVCVQNWVLARRAEGKPLTPDWLQRSDDSNDRDEEVPVPAGRSDDPEPPAPR